MSLQSFTDKKAESNIHLEVEVTEQIKEIKRLINNDIMIVQSCICNIEDRADGYLVEDKPLTLEQLYLIQNETKDLGKICDEMSDFVLRM